MGIEHYFLLEPDIIILHCAIRYIALICFFINPKIESPHLRLDLLFQTQKTIFFFGLFVAGTKPPRKMMPRIAFYILIIDEKRLRRPTRKYYKILFLLIYLYRRLMPGALPSTFQFNNQAQITAQHGIQSFL